MAASRRIVAFLLGVVVLISFDNVRSTLAYVRGVSKFWYDFVEPRQQDDLKVCDVTKWDETLNVDYVASTDDNYLLSDERDPIRRHHGPAGWKHSGNYSQLQTYLEICRAGMYNLKKDLAGRSGPATQSAIWIFMCGVECNLSDQFHLVSWLLSVFCFCFVVDSIFLRTPHKNRKRLTTPDATVWHFQLNQIHPTTEFLAIFVWKTVAACCVIYLECVENGNVN
jgi:hypothetical protein